MTAYIILALILLTFAHFVYQGIIVPDLRIGLRFQLFEIRDRVRRLRIEKPNEFGKSLFERIDSAINSQIAYQHAFDFRTVWRMLDRIDRDPSVEKKAVQFRKKIEEVEGLSEIVERLDHCFNRAVFVNSGGLVPYVVILIFVLGVKDKVSKAATLAGAESERFWSSVTTEGPRKALAG